LKHSPQSTPTPTPTPALASPLQLDDSILGVVQTLVDASTGEPVRGFHELEDGGTYVACGKKSFKQLNYGSVPDYKERRASKGPEPMPKSASRRLSKKLGACSLRFFSFIFAWATQKGRRPAQMYVHLCCNAHDSPHRSVAGKKGMLLSGTEPPLVIYCIKNGDSTGDYTQVILDKRDRTNWEKVGCSACILELIYFLLAYNWGVPRMSQRWHISALWR
jgi:hypothetical protein